MLRASRMAFLALVFSLPFMKPHLDVGGLPAIASDAIYLLAAGTLALAILRGGVRVGWDPLYAILLVYLAAMLLSAVASAQPSRVWLKLATQVYLLSLPVLAATVLRTTDDLKAAFRAWLAATAVTATIATVAVLFFYAGGPQPFGFALHELGSLPPGPYRHIASTFEYPAMLCNYLTVSLAMLLVSRHLRWIAGWPFRIMLALIIMAALFTLTPGLGGIFLMLGLWGYWCVEGPASRLLLGFGIAAAAGFIVAAAVTPFLHRTAPFLIDLPGTHLRLAPAVRMMTWIASFETFIAHPIFGTGIGTDPARVAYIDPSGTNHFPVTDAHNVFLDFAAQCGVLGLAAMVLLVIYVARRAIVAARNHNMLAVTLAAAWLDAFVYQGLTGSYEDARYLWLLLGILIAAERLGNRPEQPS